MRTLSDEDISAITTALRGHDLEHLKVCRFNITNPEDLNEALMFYRKFNEALDESKSVVRKTILVIIISTIAGLIGVGFWTKLKVSLIP